LMSRIAASFKRLEGEGRKALIPFFTAGDPDLKSVVPIMHALVEGGADVIELGVPFSDPMADGPVIQRSSERALKHGISLKDVIGAANIDLDDVSRRTARIRAHTKLPVGVGFGIRDPQTARRIASVADAVVIGSRLVQEIEACGRNEVAARVTAFMRSIRE